MRHPTGDESEMALEISSSALPCYAAELIDNSKRIYRSKRMRCGVTAQVGENVLECCPDILEYLNNDIIGCISVLPASTRRLVRRTKIWINSTYSYGPVDSPKEVRHTTSHHFSGWLLCVRDNPEKEESIEIYNAGEYQRMRLHYNGCGLLLHELCHIIHQKALPGGLRNSMVVEMHKIAEKSGKYSKVLRRDWALKETGDTDMAYCIINHKEFFAEISVAFLADCYHDVDRGAGSGASISKMAKCSPPFISPDVIERIQQHALEGRQSSCVASRFRVIFGGPHCSKFFPFTKGQLRRYDPRVYKCFVKLWQYIEAWEDDERRQCSCEWF